LITFPDSQIDPLDEFLALKVGVTRSGDPTNPNSPASQNPQYEGVLLEGGSLSRLEVLRSITALSSRFLRADSRIGTLEVGKLADVIVLDKNFMTVPDEALGRNKVLLTMLGGKVLYVADNAGLGSVKAAFANDNALSKRLEARHLGGLNGRSLTEEQKGHVRRLRQRGVCDHGHSHHH
jgi:hypothetical protein